MKEDLEDEPGKREAAAQDAAHWAFINQWQVAEQSDDRRPMNGAVANDGGMPSVQRSFARRSHQLSYKKWSKERHD
jgi:hypothetical protein